MSAHCDYIDDQCEHGDDFDTCVKQPAVNCHTKRERIAAERAALAAGGADEKEEVKNG